VAESAALQHDFGAAYAQPQRHAPLQAVKDPARRVKPYDFRHPEKLSKEQLRGLQIIQQGVSSALAAAFSSRLRSPVECRLTSLERGIYEEYVAHIGVQAIVAIIGMTPLTGYAVAAFGVDVAYGIIDRLLGGKGKHPRRALDRDLTEIETALIRHVGSDIAKSLVDPWGRVTDLTPEVTELALGPQVLHAIPPTEFVITAWYEVRFAEQVGVVSLCFPLTVLEQILPKLTGQTLFEHRPLRELAEDVRVRHDHLMPMRVPVTVTLGEAMVAASDLAALEPGDVLVLDHKVVDPLRLSVGNCERFAGSPGIRGRRVALQISGQVDDDGWVTTFEDAPE
jgi:flagellar motor switch protein FliM